MFLPIKDQISYLSQVANLVSEIHRLTNNVKREAEYDLQQTLDNGSIPPPTPSIRTSWSPEPTSSQVSSVPALPFVAPLPAHQEELRQIIKSFVKQEQTFVDFLVSIES